MEINLPNIIESNELGYLSLLKIFSICENINSGKVFFNFTNVKFFEANLCAVFGCIVEELVSKKVECYFSNMNTALESILLKNGFLNHYLKTPLAYDVYGTTVKYLALSKDDPDDTCENYILEELIYKKNFPRMSEELTEKILQNIFEVYANAKTHGRCDIIHSCGQFFPNKSNKPLNFTIVDLGKNIKDNVNNALNTNLDACECIKWALIKGNTTKINEPGGLGLSLIFDFINLNKGKIEIISSNGYYKFNTNIVKTRLLNYKFPGTIINFTFNLDDSKSYSLK